MTCPQYSSIHVFWCLAPEFIIINPTDLPTRYIFAIAYLFPVQSQWFYLARHHSFRRIIAFRRIFVLDRLPLSASLGIVLRVPHRLWKLLRWGLRLSSPCGCTSVRIFAQILRCQTLGCAQHPPHLRHRSRSWSRIWLALFRWKVFWYLGYNIRLNCYQISTIYGPEDLKETLHSNQCQNRTCLRESTTESTSRPTSTTL